MAKPKANPKKKTPSAPKRRKPQEQQARPRGKPPWVPDEDTLAKVERLASLGFTKDQIATQIGICVATLYKAQNQFADFAEAIKKGRCQGFHEATSSLMTMIKNQNLGAIIFYLKAFHGVREDSIPDAGEGRNSEALQERISGALGKLKGR